MRCCGFALRFEDLSRATLLAALTEVALQSHLLFRSYLLSVSERVSPEVAAELGPRILTGIAPITAERLMRAYDIKDTDAPAIARVLALHPSFQPAEYVTTRIEALDDTRIRFSVLPSPMFEEADDFVWLAGLLQDGDRAVAALARAINPLADAVRGEVRGGELVAYEITVDPDTAPKLEEAETALARFSGAATFEFH